MVLEDPFRGHMKVKNKSFTNHFLGSRRPLNEILQVGCFSRSGDGLIGVLCVRKYCLDYRLFEILIFYFLPGIYQMSQVLNPQTLGHSHYIVWWTSSNKDVLYLVRGRCTRSWSFAGEAEAEAAAFSSLNHETEAETEALRAKASASWSRSRSRSCFLPMSGLNPQTLGHSHYIVWWTSSNKDVLYLVRGRCTNSLGIQNETCHWHVSVGI